MAEQIDRAGNRTIEWIAFLNAAAFGVICPLLFYIFVLTDGTWMSIWIGVLIAIDSVGRIVGRLVFRSHTSTVLPQGVVFVSFALLAWVGLFQFSHNADLMIVYLSRFIGSFGSARLPSVRLLISPVDRRTNLRIITLAGFALGCALSITPMNHHHIVYSILETRGLVLPSVCGAVLSLVALSIAAISKCKWPLEGPKDLWRTFRTIVLLVTAEFAFGMFLCAGPLLERETYVFTPALVAVFLAINALISVVVQLILKTVRYSRQWVLWGLFSAGLGFGGFAIAFNVHPFHGIVTGYSLLWPAGVLVGIGHGLLQAGLPGVLQCTDEKRRRFPSGQVDEMSSIVTALASLFAAAIWAKHERSSYVIPCAMTFVALAFILFRQIVNRIKKDA